MTKENKSDIHHFSNGKTTPDYFSLKMEDGKSLNPLSDFSEIEIGIIGTGNFGQALGTKFQDSGLTVLMGSRQVLKYVSRLHHISNIVAKSICIKLNLIFQVKIAKSFTKWNVHHYTRRSIQEM